MNETFLSAPRAKLLYQVLKYSLIAWIIFKAVVLYDGAFAFLVSGDNDDIMRLMSVRGWINGQSWFDMTQYRILPPEGVDMHWSRYVDFGIASILVPLSKFMPMAQAETWTIIIWPTLLMILFLLVAAYGTNKILGPVAACFAMLSVVSWGPTSGHYFNITKLDHHSIQLLTTSILAYAMIWPGKPVVRGVIAGFAAAFSLAIGLETLPIIGLAGTIILVRASLNRPDANRFLLVFCLALVVFSFLLFAGQTAPSAWLTPHCDALSPPILILAVIASVASLVPMAAARWLGHPAARLAASAVIAGLGFWLCAPILTPCLDGPYGSLPIEVQQAISTQIGEAQPGLFFASYAPVTYNHLVTAVFAALVIASIFWLRRRKTADPVESAAAGQMIILAMAGFIVSFFQIRGIITSGPALAFITAYALKCLFDNRLAKRTTQSAILLVAGATVTLLASFLDQPIIGATKLIYGEEAAAAILPKPFPTNCRTSETLSSLDVLPPSVIFMPQDLTTSMILTTHHFGMSAPYHRNRVAMTNELRALTDFDGFKAALKSAGAKYVVLCRATKLTAGQIVGVALENGEPVDFLRPMEFANKDLRVFEVVPSKLGP
jgi:hypothetical protein